jgi:hypothetical protein
LISKSVDGDRAENRSAEIEVSSTRTTHSLKTISSP